MDNSDLFICIDHIAIAVPDRDAAVKFYTETLGWHCLHQEVNEEQGVAEAMLSPVPNPDPNMTQIQIVAPTRDDSPTAKWLEKNNGRPGLHHFAWRCEDVEVTSQLLRDRGCTLLYDPYKIGTGGSKIQFIHPKSANGVLTELVAK